MTSEGFLFLLTYANEGLYSHSPQKVVRQIAADYPKRDYLIFDAEARLAPDEHRDAAANENKALGNGEKSEIPRFRLKETDEFADVELIVED